MTTIMTRKAVEYWGNRIPPPDLAYIVDGRVVTWAEVLENRWQHQRAILARKREPAESWRAVYIHVAHYGSGLMGGWQAMLYWIGGHCWIDRDGKSFKDQLMRVYPLGLLFPDFYEWKREFARCYEKRRQCGHPVGIAFAWMCRHEIALEPSGRG